MMGGEIAEHVGQWLVEVVLPLLLSLMLAAGIALANKYIQRIQDVRIREILEELVRAAEQLFGDGRGPEKFDYVMGEAAERGLTVSRPQVEATVNALFPRFDPWPDAEGE